MLSQNQILFGNQKLQEVAISWDVPILKAAKILASKEIDVFWKWINADEFLNYKLNKPTTFVPEYYSGLNWRDAEHLIGKTVECTDNPDSWYIGKLETLSKVNKNFCVNIDKRSCWQTYIRTCEETYQHQVINICGVELPMPETVAPAPGTTCYINLYDRITWHRITWPIEISEYHKTTLRVGTLHLTEDRAKAWADWWKKEVLAKIDEVVS